MWGVDGGLTALDVTGLELRMETRAGHQGWERETPVSLRERGAGRQRRGPPRAQVTTATAEMCPPRFHTCTEAGRLVPSHLGADLDSTAPGSDTGEGDRREDRAGRRGVRRTGLEVWPRPKPRRLSQLPPRPTVGRVVGLLRERGEHADRSTPSSSDLGVF